MKKLLALLITTILVLTGCGSDSDTNSDDGSSGADGDAAAEVTSIDDAVANLDGKTITVATSSMGSDNPYSAKAKENTAEGQDSDEKKKFLDDFQEKTGVTIEFVDLDPAQQVESITSSVLAGDPIADVVRVNAGNYETLVRTGMLEDISTISELLLGDDRLPNKWEVQIGHILDGYYAIGRDDIPKPEMLAFDTDLLTKAGMDETPFDLWKRGEWTWDNARNYFTEVKAGLGDDYTVWGDYPSYIRAYGIASGGVTAVEQDGTINYTDPGVYEAMEYYKGLYDDGILKFYFDENGDRDYQQAEEAWTSGNSVFFSLQHWKTKSMAETGKSYGMVPYPIKDGLTADDVSWPSPSGDVYVIPKGTEDVNSAALVALYMELYAGYAGSDVAPGQGDPVDGDLEIAQRDLSVEGNEEAMISMREHSVYDPISAFISDSDDAFNPTQAITDYIVDGTSLTSAMENGQKELEANVETARANQGESVDELATETSEE